MFIEFKSNLIKVSGNHIANITLNDTSTGVIDVNNDLISHARYVFQQHENGQDVYTSILIRFDFTSKEVTFDQAISVTKSVLDEMINLIAYKMNLYISEPIVNTCDVIDKKLIGSGSIEIYNILPYVLPDLDASWLSVNLKMANFLKEPKSKFHFQLYKHIISIESAAARFLMLYGLLWNITGNQIKLDEFIKAQKPEVKMEKSPKCYDEKFKEKNKDKFSSDGKLWVTIYTYWRNQSQHIQSDTSIEEVEFNYELLVDDFQGLVFKAITEKLIYKENPC